MSESSLRIRIDERPDGVAVITLAGENRVSLRVLEELTRAFDRALGDVFVRAIVLTSNNDDVFLQTDTRELRALETRTAAATLVDARHALAARLGRGDKPVVCALHGEARGLGYEIALGCAARVVSDDVRTRLGCADARFGLAPSMHALQRLADIVGFDHALRLALIGSDLDAHQAVQANLATGTVTRAHLVARAVEVASGWFHGTDVESAPKKPSRYERTRIAKSFFMERAKRAHIGEQDRDDAARAKTVAILDAYARRGAAASYAVERESFIELAVASGTHRSIDVSLETEAVERENAELVASFPQSSRGETSGPSELTSHCCSPTGSTNGGSSAGETLLTEIGAKRETDPARVARAIFEAQSRATAAIVVREGPGGFARRLRVIYLNEACWLVTAGCSIDHVDRALVEWGFPLGPLALLDAIGAEETKLLADELTHASSARFTPAPFLTALARDTANQAHRPRPLYRPASTGETDRWIAKLLGPKREPGVLDDSVYARVGMPHPNPGSKPPVLREEVQMRCALPMVNEALHCLGEGVVGSARDANVASVIGLGFPAFRGGVLRYVDTLGAKELLARISAFRKHVDERFEPAPLLVDLAARGARAMAASPTPVIARPTAP